MSFKYFSRGNKIFFSPIADQIVQDPTRFSAGITRAGYIHIYQDSVKLYGLDRFTRVWLAFNEHTQELGIHFCNEKEKGNYALFFHQGIARIYAVGFLKKMGLYRRAYRSLPLSWDPLANVLCFSHPGILPKRLPVSKHPRKRLRSRPSPE